jgi:RND family efflux transporter MFP subunit
MMKKRVFIIAGIIGLIIVVAIFAVKRKQAMLAKAPIAGERAIPVTVAVAQQGQFVKSLDYVGVVEPHFSANISSRLTSEIEQVLHLEGSVVKAGELLIKLDDRKLRYDIAVLKAKREEIKTKISGNEVNVRSLQGSVSYWNKQVERDQLLVKKEIAPLKQLESSTEKLNEFKGKLDVAIQNGKTLDAELSAMKGQQSIAETNLSYTKIRSPFDGVVCEKFIDQGDLASPGKRLMVVENQQQLKVVVEVPQSDVMLLHQGQAVNVSCRGYEGNAKLSKIYPAVAQSRMVRIESYLPENSGDKLISGQHVRISMSIATLNNVTLIPATAINVDRNSENNKMVFILTDGRLKQQSIKVLGNNGKEVAVSGIKPGVKVVTSAFLGWAKLADGLKAEVIK